MEALRERGLQQQGAAPVRQPGPLDPAGHGHVVRVAGHTVWAEADHGVRADLLDQRADHAGTDLRGDAGALPVPEAEPPVVGDADCGQALHHLPPPLVGDRSVAAELTVGGGGHDDRLPGVPGLGHQRGRQVGLVVGMGPDAQDRPQFGNRHSLLHGCLLVPVGRSRRR